MAKITVECGADVFEKALVKAYQKNKNKINIPGFRKGKAPMAVIEKMYGTEVFFDDAANEVINETYPDVVEQCELDIVSRPEVDVTQIKKGEDFIYTATVAIKPEVKLGDYKGIEVDKIEVSVSDEEVDAEVKRALEQNAKKEEVKDRAIENGDEVSLDFEGFVDGVAFDGGKGTGYPLTIGSGAFIPGFEEQIVGKNIGEEFDVNVTFPEEYQEKSLAGKPAVFKCKVNSAKYTIVEEATDEFASEVSEFDTLKEYKEDIKKKLLETKENHAKQVKKDDAVAKAVLNSTIEIPGPMLETEKQQLAEEFSQRVQSQGLTLEQYLSYTGMDAKKFLDQLEPQAENRIRTRLTLEAIANAENIEVSEDEVNAEYESIANQYKMDLDQVKDILGAQSETIKEDLRVRKAADLIADAAKEVAKKAEKKTARKSTKKDAEADEAADEKKEKKTTKKATTKKAAAKKDEE